MLLMDAKPRTHWLCAVCTSAMARCSLLVWCINIQNACVMVQHTPRTLFLVCTDGGQAGLQDIQCLLRVVLCSAIRCRYVVAHYDSCHTIQLLRAYCTIWSARSCDAAVVLICTIRRATCCRHKFPSIMVSGVVLMELQ